MAFFHFKGKKNFKVIHCGACLTKSESVIILRSSVIAVTVLTTGRQGCRGSNLSDDMKFIFFYTVQTLHGFLKYTKCESNHSFSSITGDKNARSHTSIF